MKMAPFTFTVFTELRESMAVVEVREERGAERKGKKGKRKGLQDRKDTPAHCGQG